jgi:hypothetical protein
MNQRLTVALREEILAAAMRGAFSKEIERIHDKLLKLGKRFYRHTVNEELEAKLHSIPPGFIDYEDEHFFSGYVDGDLETIRGSIRLCDVGVSVPVPKSSLFASDAKAKAIEQEILQQFKALKEIERKKSELRRKLWSLVATVPTTTKLVAAWPEAAQFIPEPTSTPNLPALQIEEVNQALKDAGVQFKKAA